VTARAAAGDGWYVRLWLGFQVAAMGSDGCFGCSATIRSITASFPAVNAAEDRLPALLVRGALDLVPADRAHTLLAGVQLRAG
jgi:hypothetical protein